jgi:hypothetical protein
MLSVTLVHLGIARPQVDDEENGLKLLMVTANVLNKQ